MNRSVQARLPKESLCETARECHSKHGGHLREELLGFFEVKAVQ
jgi:hypothetical protein